MVCVTNQKSCDKLIARGMERSRGAANIHIVHCVQTGRNFMGNPMEGDAMEYLFTAAQLAGAELTLLRAPNVEEALANYAEKQNISIMILGASPGGGESFVSKLQRKLPRVEFDIIG